MNISLRNIGMSLLIGCLFCVPLSHAQTAEDEGLRVSTQRKNVDIGWNTTEADVSMILISAKGQRAERKMRVQTLEVQGDGDKSLTIFDSPNDVAGTAFLSISHALTEDDQWIYLPAVKRVKRIASKNKSGPFVGSEFAYEDMSSFELAKYKFKLLREETYEKDAVYVVEQVPIDEFSGYSKQIVWIDKAHYRARKIEYYDKKQSLLKTLYLDEHKLYKNKYWRPLRAFMENVQTGKSTELITHSLIFDVGLKDSDFDESSLRRAR